MQIKLKWKMTIWFKQTSKPKINEVLSNNFLDLFLIGLKKLIGLGLI